MKEMQKKTHQLLQEIAEICEENNLAYFLGPETLATAAIHNGFDKNIINLDLMMPVDDLTKFISVFDAVHPADRGLDYMGNHKHYLGFQVSYVDLSSTYINMNQGFNFSKFGAKVNLIPLRKRVGGFKGRLLKLLELGWECNGYRLTRKVNWRRILAAGVVRLMMVIGKGNLAKILFNLFCKQYSGHDETVVLKRIKKKAVQLNYRYFTGKSSIVFEKVVFPVPSKHEAFLAEIYGEFWRNKFLERSVSFQDTILLPKIAFHDFILAADAKSLSLMDYFRHYRLSLLSGVALLRNIKIRNHALLIARRSGDRLKYYEEFVQKREVIHNLYGKKNYAALKPIFEGHEKTTLFYLRKKIGFCVCKEFFDIQCDLFLWEGKPKTVDKLRKLVPTEHYHPII